MPDFDPMQVMLDQLLRVVLLDSIHAVVIIGLAAIGYFLFRKK